MSQTKEDVRTRYARAAKLIQSGRTGCGSCCSSSESDALNISLTGESYLQDDNSGVSQALTEASLGCGNPVALAELAPGEVVLDLGSGAGLDVLLSAKRVLPGGRAYGLDMTDEMLALAQANLAKSDISNAEFLKGEIEAIPLPDNHVDVVISNCVINLSTNKGQALQEALRVLKPGGRLAVMDLVFTQERSSLDEGLISQLEQQIGCIIGALELSEYEEKLQAAGFTNVSLEIVHQYSAQMLTGSCCGPKLPSGTLPVASAFVRASKPQI